MVFSEKYMYKIIVYRAVSTTLQKKKRKDEVKVLVLINFQTYWKG